jgi:predicted RNA polymerase sigma factor
VVALNHAIALSRWKGPRAGLNALAGIEHDLVLSAYHLLPTTLAELWNECGEKEKAARIIGRPCRTLAPNPNAAS